MAATILDGKALAARERVVVEAEVARLKERSGVVPGLAVVLVGDDPASQVYVRNKETACKAAGMSGRVVRLPADTTTSQVRETIESLNADPRVHGILLQLPLPRGLVEDELIGRIDPRKDVDGLHPENAGLLALGTPRFVPCTPLGVQRILEDAGIETRGARAVVLGRSRLVGKPMALLLMRKGPGGDATVTVAHTRTRDVAAVCREAEVLVVAAGVPGFVRGDWIRPGAVVIDVGIHKGADGRLRGDVVYEEAASVASAITPVPGGVGPMTVAMLLRNTLDAAERSAR